MTAVFKVRAIFVFGSSVVQIVFLMFMAHSRPRGLPKVLSLLVYVDLYSIYHSVTVRRHSVFIYLFIIFNGVSLGYAGLGNEVKSDGLSIEFVRRSASLEKISVVRRTSLDL